MIWDDTFTLLLEVKAAKAIRPGDVEQGLLYLRNGNFRVYVLSNFGQVLLGKKRWAQSPDQPALYGPHQWCELKYEGFLG